VSPFGRRERARSCSPIRADSRGAPVGTREEEGSPVAGTARGGHVGSGEGEELERRTEWSEAPVASPNRWARGGVREREIGGGVAQACHVEERKWERESEGAPSAAVSSAGRRTWSATAVDRALWHCCTDRGERRGAGDAVLRD
jgi:hypothetical protein